MSRTKTANAVGDKHPEAHMSEIERLRRRVQEGINAKAFDDVVQILDQAVAAGHKEFYGLRLNFWFADQWGPWPWHQMYQMLSELEAQDPKASWLKAKVAVNLGEDAFAPLERGAASGDVSCLLCLAMLALLDNQPDAALKLLMAPAVKSLPFSQIARQRLGKRSETPVKSVLASSIALSRVENFVHPVVCDWLIGQWQPLAVPASIVDPNTGGARPDPYRRSDVASVFGPRQDPVSVKIQSQIASELQLNPEGFEPLSYIRYTDAQEYRPHFDGFPEAHSQLDVSKGGQRIRTALLYLGDECAGGETAFPRLDISVAPKKGSLLYFNNAEDNGVIDARSLHAGKPVTNGEKHIVTQWVRQYPIDLRIG